MGFKENVDRLRTIKKDITMIEDYVRGVKEQVAAEIDPYMDKKKKLQAEDKALREILVIDALANKASSGQNTFGGLQLRETTEVVVNNLAEAAKDLEGEILGKVPLVEWQPVINMPALKKWVKARQELGQPIPKSIEVLTSLSVALTAE